MMMPDPNITGYVLERAIECVNGNWRFIYDAAPLGYVGLKVETIVDNWGVAVGELYRFAGHVYGTAEAAAAAWMQARAVRP